MVWADFQLTIIDRADTSGENIFRYMSRLRDSTLNSCCNLYFRLSFIVCIDSEFEMTESTHNDRWCISFHCIVVVMLCEYVYNCLIIL